MILSGLYRPPPVIMVVSLGRANTARFPSPHFHKSLLIALANTRDLISALNRNFLLDSDTGSSMHECNTCNNDKRRNVYSNAYKNGMKMTRMVENLQ